MTSLKGMFTALITPFDSDYRLDEEGLYQLIHRQIANEINGIVLLGTTGEAPTITAEEKALILRMAKQEIPPTTLFIAGTGGYATSQTIKNTLEAEEAGAHAAMIVTPYYNRPSQEGLFLHFKAIAQATSIPIIVYHNPARTGQTLQIETFARLLEIPSIIGFKDCSGNFYQMSEMIELIKNRRPDFSMLSGDDISILPLMALGAQGVISTLGNLLPSEVKELVDLAHAGNFSSARQKHYELMPLIKAMSVDTNPIPIKKALDICGLPAGNCRLPLCPISQENEAKLKSIISTKFMVLVNSPYAP